MALQNVQARTRMVLAYLHAQTALIKAGSNYFAIKLIIKNIVKLKGLEICLFLALQMLMRVWLAMSPNMVSIFIYFCLIIFSDCSSADLNPIGAVSKHDLREFLRYVNGTHKFKHLQTFVLILKILEKFI